MFLKTVSFSNLKHSEISTVTTTDSVSSNVGYWSNGKQKTTWNFNMRNLLGDKMYDANDMFFVLRLNIKLLSCIQHGEFSMKSKRPTTLCLLVRSKLC
jgi:hypothetical protein